MIVLNFPEIIFPGKTIKIEIVINAPDEQTLFPRLVNFGSASIGNDGSDDEDIIKPGEIPVSFQFPVADQFIDGVFSPSVSYSDQKYYEILGKIKQYGAAIFLYDMPAHIVFFRAFFVDELISGDSSTRTISMRFTDDLKSLTDSNPGPPLIGEYKYLKTFIKELLPNIIDVSFVTDFRFRYNIESDEAGDQTPCYIHQVGALSTDIYNERFTTKGDILKAILNNFASFGLISFDRYFYVLPIFYNNASTRTISKSKLEGGSEIEYGKNYNALAKYFQVHNSNNKIEYRFGYAGKYYEDWEQNSLVKKIDSLFAVGEDIPTDSSLPLPQRTWATNLYYLSAPGSPFPLFGYKVSYKRADGTYSEERSLHQWAKTLLYENYIGLKRTIKETVPGIDYRFNTYYQREGISAVFRAKNISIDYDKDQTTLLLQECINADNYLDPVITCFNRMLRVFDYTVTIKKKSADSLFRYQAIEGALHTTLPDAPYLSGEQVNVKIRNAYNCRRNSAVEYDGIELAVSSEDLKIWLERWTYLIYIAIGKTKTTTAPASPYPISNDANADWYLLASLPDHKIDNPDYYYEYTTSARMLQTKNPFWIWAGLKSSSATLFDGIPVYAK